MNQPAATPSVRRNDAERRYEILLDGTIAGSTEYRDRGDRRVFHHTETDDAFAGQGLASQLVQQALTDVRASDRRVVPVCPFVAHYVEKHHDFDDIVDPVTADVLEWLRNELR